jgi:hypothetical protein
MSNPRLNKLLLRLASSDEVPDPFVAGYVRRLRNYVEACLKATEMGDWEAANDALIHSCRLSQVLRLEVGELSQLDHLSRSVIQRYLGQVATCVRESPGFLPGLSVKSRDWAQKAIENIVARLNEVSVDEEPRNQAGRPR